jgi:hypothetical protein
MNANTLSSEVVPTLRVVSKKTADLEGYIPLTVGIHSRKEAQLFESIQKGLENTRAVWINENTPFYTAARHRSEIKAIENETNVSDYRNDARNALKSKLGDNFPAFLSTVQPEFGKTGAELLESIPRLILKRLIEIENETRTPLAIEGLLSSDQLRGKEIDQ